MEQIEQYLDGLFAPLPHNTSMGNVRQNLGHNMLERYNELVALGTPGQQAGAQVVEEFSQQEGAMTQTRQEGLSRTYAAFQKKYPLYMAIGFGGMLVIPLILLFFFLNLESKIVGLTAWIFSVLVFVAFIICVTFRGETYKKKLGLKNK